MENKRRQATSLETLIATAIKATKRKTTDYDTKVYNVTNNEMNNSEISLMTADLLRTTHVGSNS